MTNRDQAEFWTASAGPTWVTYQDDMDALLLPVLELMMDRADLHPGQSALDIGCGTGSSVARIAQAVGPDGHVTGLDISKTMLEQAHMRLGFRPQVQLTMADAQTHAFDRRFDAILSRFGVMFFEDSTAAFANLWRALAPGGRMTLLAWGPVRENPWFTDAAAAARSVLGPMPKVDRTRPGPFAFEDAGRVLGMMRDAGIPAPEVETVTTDLTPSGGLKDVAELCCHIGPADSALQYHEAGETDIAAVKAALIDRFAPYARPDGIRIPATLHVYCAHKPV